jgi:hypothetical protein
MNFYKNTKIVSIIKTKPYFVIENDDIITFLNSMSVLNTASSDYTERLLVKFEEIMLYLLYKYKENLNLFVFFNFQRSFTV